MERDWIMVCHGDVFYRVIPVLVQVPLTYLEAAAAAAAVSHGNTDDAVSSTSMSFLSV